MVLEWRRGLSGEVLLYARGAGRVDGFQSCPITSASKHHHGCPGPVDSKVKFGVGGYVRSCYVLVQQLLDALAVPFDCM